MIISAIFGSSYFLLSCKGSLKPEEYYRWNNRSKSVLKKTISLKHYRFDITFRPKEFMALAQLNGEKLTRSTISQSLKGFECCRHFKIQISSKDSSDVLKYKLRSNDEYSARIKYLSNDIQQHLFLVENKDTLPCTFILYERTFKMKPDATVMAFFERKSNNQSEQIPMELIITRGGFNPDKLSFKYSQKDLNTIPKLSI